ncbi:MAG: glycerol-3-phosphate 1-O-acyltransferase PlsY [Planctomycetota bacterium]|jgi:glycerol-3-phosphate acyltransferase PlsY
MIDHPLMLFAVFPLLAYVVGSTPFGVIIARVHRVDLRKAGSGNVGATNVGRVVGRPWGYLCFALDCAKGFVPVLAMGLIVRGRSGLPTEAQQVAWLAVGCGTIVGHVFSFWLRFRGGKGVATSLGVVLGVFPYFTYAGLAVLVLWVIVVVVGRYVSLASIAAAVAFLPLFVAFSFTFGWGVGNVRPLMAFAGAMAVLIIIRHRSNIRRLLRGTEHKIGRPRAMSGPAGETADRQEK